MPLKIKDVAFVQFTATDMARARKFYEEAIGLKATLTYDAGAGKAWIEYDIGATTLAISNMFPPSGQGGACLALEVPSVDEAIASLKASGVTPTWGPMDTPGCRLCGFNDPDGNQLALHQRKSA
jgi:predicted enzyme related to lactoylglutathione lyase